MQKKKFIGDFQIISSRVHRFVTNKCRELEV